MFFNFGQKPTDEPKAEMKVEAPKVAETRSVYIHDLYYTEEVSQVNVPLQDGSIIRYDVGFGAGSQEKPIKPLHDYEYLIFSSVSILTAQQEYELSLALEKNVPIIVLSSDEYNHNDYNKKQICPFFGLLTSKIINFSYRVTSNFGKEYKNVKELFKPWAEYWKNYRICFSQLPKGSEELAQNKADEPVAWRRNNLFFIPAALLGNLNEYSDYGNRAYYYQKRTEYVQHLIIFLNRLKPHSVEPSWFDKLYFLNEESLIKDRTKLQLEIDRIRKLKRIYFVDGGELEELFSQICSEIGIKTEKIGTSDFVIRETNPPIILELTGREKNLTKDKVGQIIGHIIEQEVNLGKDAQKTLVINHERLINPTERGKLEPYALGLYKNKGINVVSILDFLSLYSKIKKAEEGKEAMIKLLNGR